MSPLFKFILLGSIALAVSLQAQYQDEPVLQVRSNAQYQDEPVLQIRNNGQDDGQDVFVIAPNGTVGERTSIGDLLVDTTELAVDAVGSVAGTVGGAVKKGITAGSVIVNGAGEIIGTVVKTPLNMAAAGLSTVGQGVSNLGDIVARKQAPRGSKANAAAQAQSPNYGYPPVYYPPINQNQNYPSYSLTDYSANDSVDQKPNSSPNQEANDSPVHVAKRSACASPQDIEIRKYQYPSNGQAIQVSNSASVQTRYQNPSSSVVISPNPAVSRNVYLQYPQQQSQIISQYPAPQIHPIRNGLFGGLLNVLSTGVNAAVGSINTGVSGVGNTVNSIVGAGKTLTDTLHVIQRLQGVKGIPTLARELSSDQPNIDVIINTIADNKEGLSELATAVLGKIKSNQNVQQIVNEAKHGDISTLKFLVDKVQENPHVQELVHEYKEKGKQNEFVQDILEHWDQKDLSPIKTLVGKVTKNEKITSVVNDAVDNLNHNEGVKKILEDIENGGLSSISISVLKSVKGKNPKDLMKQLKHGDFSMFKNIAENVQENPDYRHLRQHVAVTVNNSEKMKDIVHKLKHSNAMKVTKRFSQKGSQYLDLDNDLVGLAKDVEDDS